MLPVTFLTFAMGYLAIIGFPGFSGFWSKDKIIETALAENWLVGLVRAARRRRHRLLHDAADADDLLHQPALGEGRPPARVAQGDDGPAGRARRPLGARRLLLAGRLDRRLPRPGRRAPRRRSSPRSRPSGITVLAVLVVAIGVCTAWVLVGKQDVPRDAPTDVSFATRPPATTSTAMPSTRVRGPAGAPARGRPALDGPQRRRRRADRRPGAVRALGGQLRRVQNGYVRSYALSLLVGVLLVVLALLAVKLA